MNTNGINNTKTPPSAMPENLVDEEQGAVGGIQNVQPTTENMATTKVLLKVQHHILYSAEHHPSQTACITNTIASYQGVAFNEECSLDDKGDHHHRSTFIKEVANDAAIVPSEAGFIQETAFVLLDADMRAALDPKDGEVPIHYTSLTQLNLPEKVPCWENIKRTVDPEKEATMDNLLTLNCQVLEQGRHLHSHWRFKNLPANNNLIPATAAMAQRTYTRLSSAEQEKLELEIAQAKTLQAMSTMSLQQPSTEKDEEESTATTPSFPLQFPPAKD